MERVTVANTLRSFIRENYLLGRDFTFADGDSFLEHSIIDSIGILQLVTFLQDTYGVTVQDDELLPENLDSVNAVTAYLCRKLDRKDSPQDAQASQANPEGESGSPRQSAAAIGLNGVAVAGDAPATQGTPGERA